MPGSRLYRGRVHRHPPFLKGSLSPFSPLVCVRSSTCTNSYPPLRDAVEDILEETSGMTGCGDAATVGEGLRQSQRLRDTVGTHGRGSNTMNPQRSPRTETVESPDPSTGTIGACKTSNFVRFNPFHPKLMARVLPLWRA